MTRECRGRWRLLLQTAALTAWLAGAGYRAPEPTFQGFGAGTTGGAGGPVVTVTNLNDSGPGSLRQAIAAGNRTVVFGLAGDIVLASYLHVLGAHLTIDGATAPPPGVTLRSAGLVIRGSEGAHDVIVRAIRVRGAPLDGIQVASGAYNVVIDHVSVHGAGDGNLDITEGARNVTVSWSIFAEPASGKTMLIKYGATRVSLHHSLFVNGATRNPLVASDDAGTPAADTTVDMRNNVVWGWGRGYGTAVRYGARANIVANVYASPASSPRHRRNALVVSEARAAGRARLAAGRAYVRANVSGDGLPFDVDALGTEAGPFPAVPVDTEPGCLAARRVVAGAGVRPLDEVDRRAVVAVTLPRCPDAGAGAAELETAR